MSDSDPSLLADETVALVRSWMEAGREATTRLDRRTSRRLHELVDDPNGVPFTMRFVDRVIRPDRDADAAHQLRILAGGDRPLPRFLGPVDRLLLRVGARLAPRLPWLVMPLARRRMRQIVGHLVVDAGERPLRAHLADRRADGFAQNVNLLGEAVLGEREAARRLRATIDLLSQPDVDYVSVKISGVASQLNHWDHDGSVDRISDALRTILRAAASADTFVNLDMEEFHDLDLTVAAFRRVLDEPGFSSQRAGIVLQAYLPDSFDVLTDLVTWANERGSRDGGDIKIRLVKGANLAMEQVDAAMHGWDAAPYPTKHETDANYKRCLDWALQPDRLTHVHLGVASHNLFDVAWATLLAHRRGVTDRVGIEMLEGMAPGEARVIRDAEGELLLYTPVVDPADFDVAISYLFRRLEENAAPGNFLRVLGDLDADSAAFAEQERAFRAALAERQQPSRATRRAVDRSEPPVPFGLAPFDNEAESDPTNAGTRAWADAARRRTPTPVQTPMTQDTETLDLLLANARAAGAAWFARTPEDRRTVLRAVADQLAAHRGDLLTAMVHEGNKTVAQADPEICEAIDFARYYADRTTELSAEHARFEPHGVIAVVPPWNFPVAIPTGGMLSSLAAGNAVVCKPAPEVPRCSEIIVEAAHEAGVPRDLLQLVPVPEDDVGRHLLTSVDAVILTGASETADLFRSWDPAMRLHAETSGKNALVITPHADMDLAVTDLVASAFGHAGQKCSAASLAICVGDVLDDPRFRRQLVDAVESLVVGPAADPATNVNPLIGEPNPRLARALAAEDPDVAWLVPPVQIDETTWRPGVRTEVAPESWFRRTECFGPVLGLVRAADLDEAIAIQNDSDFGLTGGIHSLDPEEVARWVDQVEVGNAYVNRGITGAIVQRQPFGGWKRSSVGPGAKAGGPNYVAQLGTWHPISTLDPDVWRVEDERWWRDEGSVDHDPTGLFCESNVFRYRPHPGVGLCVADGADPRAVSRVRDAAAVAGVDLADVAPDATTDDLVRSGVERIRVVGVVPDPLRRAAVAAGAHLWDGPVTNDGGRELLAMVREQSVSTTLHRFGNLVGVTD